MEHRVEVVRIKDVQPHPNADRLDVATVFGFPVICRRGEYAVGDLAVYVPIDSVVPLSEEWAWLHGGKLKNCRIEAKKLRGIFSMGLLTRLTVTAGEGDNVAEQLLITKYVPPEPKAYRGGQSSGWDCEAGEPVGVARYTDLEALRRWPDVLQPGEEVVATEKIHGANFRAVWQDGRLWVGSHRQWKKQGKNIWWRAAEKYGLAAKLETAPGFVVYGEVFGDVQDLRYGMKPGEVDLRVFDIFSAWEGKYVDWDLLVKSCEVLDLPLPPILYKGPWQGLDHMAAVAEGETHVDFGAGHIREGVVVKPVTERWDRHVGRVVLKLVSQAYLLRKGGTEGK